jgi:hypothetical protein
LGLPVQGITDVGTTINTTASKVDTCETNISSLNSSIGSINTNLTVLNTLTLCLTLAGGLYSISCSSLAVGEGLSAASAGISGALSAG